MSPQRVVVVGASCAGKTTFSRALAKKLGAPHVHLDELHWEANWTPASNEKFRERVAQATAGDTWVVDGNYTNKLESLAWKKADTIIWLDPPLWLVLVRFTRRTLWRVITREELWKGNRENLRTAIFSKDSLLYWILSTHRRRQNQFREAMEGNQYPQARFVYLRSPIDCAEYLGKAQ